MGSLQKSEKNCPRVDSHKYGSIISRSSPGLPVTIGSNPFLSCFVQPVIRIIEMRDRRKMDLRITGDFMFMIIKDIAQNSSQSIEFSKYIF